MTQIPRTAGRQSNPGDPNSEDPEGDNPNPEDPEGDNPNPEDPEGDNPNPEDPEGEDPSEDPEGDNPNPNDPGDNPQPEEPEGDNPDPNDPDPNDPGDDPQPELPEGGDPNPEDPEGDNPNPNDPDPNDPGDDPQPDDPQPEDPQPEEPEGDNPNPDNPNPNDPADDPGPAPLEGCDPQAAGTGLPPLSAPSFSVRAAPLTEAFPALSQSGMIHFPDGAVSFVPSGGGWEGYIAAGNASYRMTGSSPQAMSLASPQPVIAPSGDPQSPHHGYGGVTTVFPCGGELVAFFHGENHQIPAPPQPGSPPPYHASMCRATGPMGAGWFSVDATPWVLATGGQATYQAPKIAYGAGGGAVFDPGGDYLYLYYFDWEGSQGVHLARACKSGCGAPGTWRKYHNGAFTSDALGVGFLPPSGPSSVIVPTGPGAFDAFTTLSHNTYLNAYLMASATESGVALRVSADGINWGPRVMVLIHHAAVDQTMRVLYPTLLDGLSWSRNQSGRQIKLIVGVEMDQAGAKVAHRAYVLDLELSLASDAPTATYHRKKLTRWFNPAAPFDHWCTTAPVGGYQNEGGLGQLAAAPEPGTRPFYDCVFSDGDHMVSIASSCEGGTSLGVMGYAWVGPGPGRHPVYRCWMNDPTGGIDHFVSTDPACEGQSVESVIGYLE